MTTTPAYAISSEAWLQNNESHLQQIWTDAQGGKFVGQRGVSIAYRIFSDDAAKPAIVISNGRTENMMKYLQVIYDLLNNGYQIFILDHRGQGFSARELDLAQDPSQAAWRRGDVIDFDDYVADLRTFIDDIVQPRISGKLYLLGHSMGSAIATVYLVQQKSAVSAAALVSPMYRPKVPMSALLCRLLRLLCLMGQGRQGLPGSTDYKPQDPDNNDLTSSRVRTVWFNDIADTHPETQLQGFSFRWGSTVCDLVDNRLPGMVSGIQTPLLILQAEQDQIVCNADQDLICARINAATPELCRLQVIAGARHEILLEADSMRDVGLQSILKHFADHA